MKRFLILICIALLSACQPLVVNSVTSTPGDAIDPFLTTPTRISITHAPSSTVTYTSAPSQTLVPTETPTPIPPESFDPSIIPTFTPSSPAQCPMEDPNLEFDVQEALEPLTWSEQHQHLTEYVLDFLNSGGTLQSILSAFEESISKDAKLFFRVQDVTGDNISELIFPYGSWLDIFGCTDGKYELMFTDTYESNMGGVSILDITDINKDGLADIVVYFSGCINNRCPIIRSYEWNATNFQNLMGQPSPSTWNACSSLTVAPFEVNIKDIDNNGTKEIILSNSGNPWPDNDFPYRKETLVCMWNGQNIVVYKGEFDAPYYRFQAVQDGDTATLSGDYDKALGFYQQTIIDKNLQWFTQDRKWHDFWIYHSNLFSSEPTPTASPDLVPDPNEYSVLAAYAYYRIMLLHVVQNNIEKAELALNTLQSEFPPESQGNYFAQAASIFWQDYQISMKIENSCRKVVEYAQEHPIPIKYLGDWEHGVHSLQYTPESICPFE